MNCEIEIPRTTYEGMCGFFQRWSDIYSIEGASILRGSLRNPFGETASMLFTPEQPAGNASQLASAYTCALHALGRAKLLRNSVVIDLRDLEEDETEALLFCADVALLRGPQVRVLENLRIQIRLFNDLPAMVRLALAANR